MRETLTRTIAAPCVALALASCGAQAPARRGEASAQSAVWRNDAPAAYLRSPRATGQRGARLSAHWLSRDGTVTETDPRGRAVVWPAPVRIAAAPAFRIATPATPNRLDLRVFGGGVDARGVPREPPQLISCSQGARARACRFTVRRHGIDVELRTPVVRPVARFVLYARWYVPLAQRPPRARSNPTVSASWGFVAARSARRGQSGRR